MIPIFVINLDRAQERWSRASAAAREHGLALTRVPAVDGRTLTETDRAVIDPQRFTRITGRRVLPGEIGCHLSHRKALMAFLDTDASHGVVMEDDVVALPDTRRRLEAVLAAISPDVDIVKLVNHRANGFIESARTSAGDRLGRTLFGPQGSAAGYLVSRRGAGGLLKRLEAMSMPYDVELERGWARRQNVLTVKEPLFAFTELRATSAIGDRNDYRQGKLFWLLRIPTAVFRTSELTRRIVYAIAG